MNRPLGPTAAALTGVQVGLALVVTRAIADRVGPLQLGLLRNAVGVVLLPFFLRARHAAIARRDLLPVLALRVVQFGLLIALLNASVQRISAAHAAVIFATFPLLTMAVSAARAEIRARVVSSSAAMAARRVRVSASGA